MSTVVENDFRSEVFIPMTSQLVSKLGLRDAYVLSAIRFRTNTRHADTVDVDGVLWWRTTIPDLAEFLSISVAQVRAALKSLTDCGVLESAAHAVDGWPDRTLSYRVTVAKSSTSMCRNPALPICRNPADVPLLLKKLNNPADEETSEPVRKRGPHLLPDGWVPTEKHRVKAEALGVDVEAAADAMRKWAFVGDKRKSNWNGTFNAFLTNQKPSVVSHVSAAARVDRLIASGDREAMERLTGVRFDPDFGDVSPRERFERLGVEWPVWAVENRGRLVDAVVARSKRSD